MTEWLLSGHNTQESLALARPLTATAVEANLNIAVSWTIERLAGDTADFDPTLFPSAVVQGWVYINIDYASRNMARVLPFDAASVGVPSELVPSPEPVVKRRLLRLPFRYRELYKWTKAFYQEQLPAQTEDTLRRYWALHDDPDLPLAEVWPLFEPDFVERLIVDAQAHGVVSITVAVLDAILRERAPQLLNLFAGQATATSLIGQRIWELSRVAAACGEEVASLLTSGVTDLAAYEALPAAAPLLEGLRRFLRDYGHRGFRYELDFGAERFVDRPEQVLVAVAGQLQEGRPPEVRAQEMQAASREALQRMNPVARALWRRVLDWAQQLIAWREASKSYTSLHHALYGAVARRLSREFYPQETEPLLMFYTFEEFLAFGRSQGEARVALETLERRRAEFVLRDGQPTPPELLRYNPETQHWRPVLSEDVASEEAAPRQFQGIAACGGAAPVEGIALVTNDPVEAGRRLLEIEGPVILVTRLTDPAWSSLFGRLSAVVTELGGLISHATIVARENGLPAVVGVPEITHWIRNGQRLRVDGTRGVVEILSSTT